jgi:tryptophan-rich sensory protein
MQPMNSKDDLGTIQSLVERREICRAIFARVAFTMGALSILAAVAIYLNDERTQFLRRPIRPREFAFVWIIIFAVAALVAGLLLSKAGDNKDEFRAARLRMMLSAIAPCLLIAAAFTMWFFATGYLGAAELDLVVVWIACYGLMLLSTSFFASRSIALLGWAFLLTGLSAPILADKIEILTDNAPVTLMGVSFGVYHVIYAALNWRRPKNP